MAVGERFTLGLMSVTMATVYVRGSDPDGAFSIICTFIGWATMIVMGLVLMVSNGTPKGR